MAKIDEKLEKLENLEPILKKCNDLFLGEAKIFNETYLPKRFQESEEGYKARLANTEFIGYFSSIIKEIVGLVTKKDPVVFGFEKFDLTNLDFDKNDLNSFVKKLTLYSLIDGICFVSVKTNLVLNKVYFKIHRYIDLMSYAFNEGDLEQIVFKEIVEVPAADFGLEIRERYLAFTKEGGEIWFDDGGGLAKQEEWKNSLEELPISFVLTGKEITKFEIIPPLYDLAELNFTMLNLSTQIANIANLISSPVAVFFGKIIDDRRDFQVGGKNALVFQDKTTEDFKYVSADSTGISALFIRYKQIADSMDKISFSLLTNDTSKTIIDAQQNQLKNTAFLSSVAIELESKINILFKHFAAVSNVSLKEDAYIEFQKDFSDILVSDSQLKLLHELVKEGKLALETYWAKLKSLNILAKDFDPEVELSRLE